MRAIIFCVWQHQPLRSPPCRARDALGGASRHPVADFLPGYEASSGTAWARQRARLLTRRSRPPLADPKMKTRFADLGDIAIAGSPVDFGKLLADETEKLGKVIRAAKIKPE
jgi:hypothetical protein